MTLHVGDFENNANLVRPKSQCSMADIQNGLRSQSYQNHGLVLLRRRQLCAHDLQFSCQGSGTGRADGRSAPELTRAVPITEDMRADRHPGEAAQPASTLREITDQAEVIHGHG